MADESHWIERAQTAEASLKTLRDATDAMKERIRAAKEFLGVRELSNGAFDVDFDKFVENLGAENALQVRQIIDEKYGFKGKPGEKPRVVVPASQ